MLNKSIMRHRSIRGIRSLDLGKAKKTELPGGSSLKDSGSLSLSWPYMVLNKLKG